MAKAKILISGNSQAVRLPKQFRVKGDEVEIFRRGDEIVLRETPTNSQALSSSCANFPNSKERTIRLKSGMGSDGRAHLPPRHEYMHLHSTGAPQGSAGPI